MEDSGPERAGSVELAEEDIFPDPTSGRVMSENRNTVQLRQGSDSAAMTTAGTAATATALTATLGLAAASWVVVVRQMNGMDMGVATRLGSFAFFVALWMWMMAAMMLPGAAPAVSRHAQARGRMRAVPSFVGSYLAVWTLVGVAVYALYRPHGAAARASARDSSSGSTASARASD
jgi:predicted metal-binding membrane protein